MNHDSCAYPAAPPPFPIHLTVLPEHPCVYRPDRMSIDRAFMVDELPGRVYHEFMDSAFRRSGRLIYQPICRGCRECLPLRVPVKTFSPNKSQRRSLKRNADLLVEIAEPLATDEKFTLYTRYQSAWHGKDPDDHRSREGFEAFLYNSPVQSIEFTYRDNSNRLLAVGICDICSASLSTVYFYFDPDQAHRSLGTFGAMCEIAHAGQMRIPYYYMGYWVRGSVNMSYKANFCPHEVLLPDGRWIERSNQNNLCMQNEIDDDKV